MAKGVNGISRRRKTGTGFFSIDEAEEIQQSVGKATGGGYASLSASVEHICIDYLNIHRHVSGEEIQQIKEIAQTESLCEALSILALKQIGS